MAYPIECPFSIIAWGSIAAEDAPSDERDAPFKCTSIRLVVFADVMI